MGSIQKYDVHVVIANILATRKEQVLLVQAGTNGWSKGQQAAANAKMDAVKQEPHDEFPIEHPLVSAVVDLHRCFRCRPLST